MTAETIKLMESKLNQAEMHAHRHSCQDHGASILMLVEVVRALLKGQAKGKCAERLKAKRL